MKLDTVLYECMMTNEIINVFWDNLDVCTL